MMGALQNHRDQEVTVSVKSLVPEDHFLRAVEVTIDFSFIVEKLQPYYCEVYLLKRANNKKYDVSIRKIDRNLSNG